MPEQYPQIPKTPKAKSWAINKKRAFFISILLLLMVLFFIFLNFLENPLKEETTALTSKPMTLSYACPRQNMVILTIDGGGSRGVIPLAFLEQLESISGKNTSQVFDLMTGVSTGTIITNALAVGADGINSKYSAKTLLALYKNDAKVIFNDSFFHKIRTLWGLIGPRLSGEGKKKILHSYFGNLRLGDLNNNVVIFSYDLLHAKISMFCKWSICNSLSNSFPISQLISGATSIPAIFPPVVLYKNAREKVLTLSDLSLMINNPAYLSYLISKKVCSNLNHYIIVSLGTGHYPLMNTKALKENSGAFVWIPNILAASLEMSSEIIDNYMVLLMRAEEHWPKGSRLPKLIYLRFNPIIEWSRKNPMDSSPEALALLANKASRAFKENKELISCIATIKQKDFISEHCSFLILKYINDQNRVLLNEDNLPRIIS